MVNAVDSQTVSYVMLLKKVKVIFEEVKNHFTIKRIEVLHYGLYVVKNESFVRENEVSARK